MFNEKDNRPIISFWLQNPSRNWKDFAPGAIHERLFDEVFDNPDPSRSHVITLHLYVEYWLDRLLRKKGLSQSCTFHKKIETLRNQGVLEDALAVNLDAINKLRNIYAHELDLLAANMRAQDLINQLVIDPCFHSTDPDRLRLICIQVMFLLEATYHNDCKPPKIQFPHDEVKTHLVADGKLHWQQCEILTREDYDHIQQFVLRCPYCQIGTIMREKDGTPGFKDSFMTACQNCGLTGNGSELDLNTIRKR
jgi:hypothetical protein